MYYKELTWVGLSGVDIVEGCYAVKVRSDEEPWRHSDLCNIYARV